MARRMAILVCGMLVCATWAWAQSGEDDDDDGIHSKHAKSVWRVRYQPNEDLGDDFKKARRKIFEMKYRGVRVKIVRTKTRDEPIPEDYKVDVKIIKDPGGGELAKFENLLVEKIAGIPGGQNRMALRTVVANYPPGSSDANRTHTFQLFAIWHPGHDPQSRKDDTLHVRLVGKPVGHMAQTAEAPKMDDNCDEEPDTDVLEEEEEP
jgi:hypothetical protein